MTSLLSQMTVYDSHLNEYTESGQAVSRSVKKRTKAFSLCLQFVWTQVTKNASSGKRIDRGSLALGPLLS